MSATHPNPDPVLPPAPQSPADPCPECGLDRALQPTAHPDPWLGRKWAAPLLATLAVAGLVVVMNFANAETKTTFSAPFVRAGAQNAGVATYAELRDSAAHCGLCQTLLQESTGDALFENSSLALMWEAPPSHQTRHTVIGWPLTLMEQYAPVDGSAGNAPTPSGQGFRMRGRLSGTTWTMPYLFHQGQSLPAHRWIHFGSLAVGILALQLIWLTTALTQRAALAITARRRRRRGVCARCAYRLTPPPTPHQ